MTVRLEADTLIRHATLLTLDEDQTVYDPGAIAIIAGRIVDMGPDDIVGSRFHSAREIDCRGGFVLPGLVNLHTHASLALMRGLSTRSSEAKTSLSSSSSSTSRGRSGQLALELLEMDVESALVGFELAAAEMIRSGITTFVDMHHYSDPLLPLVERIGMRVVLGEIASDFSLDPKKLGEDRTLKMLERHLSRYEGHELIQPAVAPHALHTVSPEIIKRAAGLAREAGVPLLIHLAESEYEMSFVRQMARMRPVRWLDELGGLGSQTIAARAVHLDREDIARLAHRGATVAHCPQSSLAREGTSGPFDELVGAGVRVGLGTDDPTAHGTLDLFSEMKFARLLQGVSTPLQAEDFLSMATSRGADAIARSDLGRLRIQSTADLIVLDAHEVKMVGRDDPFDTLVMRAGPGDVRHVMVQGRWLLFDRALQTIDEEDLVRRARVARRTTEPLLERQGLLIKP